MVTVSGSPARVGKLIERTASVPTETGATPVGVAPESPPVSVGSVPDPVVGGVPPESAPVPGVPLPPSVEVTDVEGADPLSVVVAGVEVVGYVSTYEHRVCRVFTAVPVPL